MTRTSPTPASVTSLVALKQATYVREDYGDGKAYIIYQHMRTPGLTENFYKAVQQDPGDFPDQGPGEPGVEERRGPDRRGRRHPARARPSRSRPTWSCSPPAWCRRPRTTR
ncbi:MAG: hypothetical protein MZV70_06885 [Desulfobacterales bacterium]|nr:hypothetical protein [Desulfobacterales bacterium]